MFKNIHLAVVGGGSGGHITPLINLLDYIDTDRQDENISQTVIWFGEKKGMEYSFRQKYHSQRSNIRVFFVPIIVGKYRRETIWISRWRNIRDILLFPLGVVQSCRQLWDKEINLLFCKGGYVSLPVAIAAYLLRIPVLLHESDTKPGLTNRLISKRAKLCFTGFPDIFLYGIYTGQILSPKLTQVSQSTDYQTIATRILEQKDKTIILLNGGSLGAQKLYHATLQALTSITNRSEDYACIVINGRHLIEKEKDHPSLFISGLITDPAAMGLCYQHAALGIVRGGTTTLAEAKLFDLPLIIVPLPVTHDQTTNAQWYVEHYGDSLISQNSSDFQARLQREIVNAALLATRARQDVNSDKQNTHSSAQAIIYQHILSFAQKY